MIRGEVASFGEIRKVFKNLGGADFGMDAEQQDFVRWKLRLGGEEGCDTEGQEGEEKPLECSVWSRDLVQKLSK